MLPTKETVWPVGFGSGGGFVDGFGSGGGFGDDVLEVRGKCGFVGGEGGGTCGFVGRGTYGFVGGRCGFVGRGTYRFVGGEGGGVDGVGRSVGRGTCGFVGGEGGSGISFGVLACSLSSAGVRSFYRTARQRAMPERARSRSESSGSDSGTRLSVLTRRARASPCHACRSAGSLRIGWLSVDTSTSSAITAR